MNAADLAVLNLSHLTSRCRDTGMSDIRFINKNGTGVDIATVRKRFFEAAADAEINPLYASRMWHDALNRDADARELIEQLCHIEIVDGDTGFGFL